MVKRRCRYCGCDISDRPSNHYLCYSCWKKANGRTYSYNKKSYKSNYSSNSYTTYSGSSYSKSYSQVNDKYYEYKDTSLDYGPDWDYEEYPPENL